MPDSGNSYHVFLVEDDEMFRRILKDTLGKDARLRISGYSSGEECLEHLSEHPDLVVLDYMMEGISGLDTLKKIKEADSRIPVVMLSGQDRMDIAVELLRNGAYDYIIKDEGAIARAQHVVSNIVKSLELRKKHQKIRYLAYVLGVAVVFSLGFIGWEQYRIMNERLHQAEATLKLTENLRRQDYIKQFLQDFVGSTVSVSDYMNSGDITQRDQFSAYAERMRAELDELGKYVGGDKAEGEIYNAINEKYTRFHQVGDSLLALDTPKGNPNAMRWMGEILSLQEVLVEKGQEYNQLVDEQVQNTRDQAEKTKEKHN